MGLDATSVAMPEGYVPVSATRSLERGVKDSYGVVKDTYAGST